ncbi:MAG: hypothetical protein LBU27_04690 [Candidatus Peribacteria bacterium]|jgi:hypothetical protein|nr:hypothetical protein [Candidatus Peribacteria bacterium]
MKKNVVNVVVMGILFSLIALTFGCQDNNDFVIDENSSTLNSEELLWKQSRYDYSYLEGMNGIANKYLSNITLTDEDLRQLQEVANVAFGDYLTEITLNWEKRNVSFLDDSLFATQEAKEEFYWLLIRDLHDSPGYGEEVLKSSPNIRILPRHVGERNDYLFLPIRVHGAHQGRALYDEEGNDTETDSWLYYVVQLKRDENSPYGWKIYYASSWIYRSIFGSIADGPWTIMLNEQDDFSPKSRNSISPFEREYLNGQRDIMPSVHIANPQTKNLYSQSSSYNNQGAASYAYLYAYS